MKTTITSTIRDGGRITVNAQFEFPEGEWTPESAEAAVREFRADPNGGMVAAIRSMTPEDRRIAAQVGLSPIKFAMYNTQRK